MKTRTERALVALAILGLASCSSSEGDAGAGGSTDDAGSTATGTTGSSSSSSSSNGSGAADGGGGSGGAAGTGGEGGIACPVPPDPAVCEAHNDMPGTACGADGCLSSIYYKVAIVDGECRNSEVFGCLSVDQCAADPDAPQTYWRDDTVISWGLHCGLQGWTPCDGSPGEPEACACEDFNPGLCDAP